MGSLSPLLPLHASSLRCRLCHRESNLVFRKISPFFDCGEDHEVGRPG